MRPGRHGTTHVPGPGPTLRSRAMHASALLLLALWSLELAILVVGLPAWAGAVALGLFAVYLLLALALAGVSNAILCLLIVAGTAAVTLLDRQPQAVAQAAAAALVFTAFLPALHLLRALAAEHPAILRYRERLAAAPPGTRAPQLLVGAHLLGSTLTVGAVAVLSPAIQSEPDEERRRRAALALVAGISLASLWSPLFVAMAVVSSFLPAVPLPALIGVGMVLAAIGLAIALAQLGQLPPRDMRLRVVLLDLRPLLVAGAAAAATVVALRSTTAWSTLEAASIVILLFCLAIGWPSHRSTFRRACATTGADMRHMSGEVAVVSLAFVLGAVMRASPTVESLSSTLALGGQLPVLTLFGVSAGIAIAAAAGVHPIVAASLTLGMVRPEEGILSGLALASAVILGWSTGAMVAVAGLIIIVAVGMLGVSRRQLLLGENTLLVVLLLIVGTLLLTALNALIA